MKARKTILVVLCVCLLVACLVFFAIRAVQTREKNETPMEEEDLLAYLAEQLPGNVEREEAQNLFWDPISDLSPDPDESPH